jgi:hypothetical protein
MNVSLARTWTCGVVGFVGHFGERLANRFGRKVAHRVRISDFLYRAGWFRQRFLKIKPKLS